LIFPLFVVVDLEYNVIYIYIYKVVLSVKVGSIWLVGQAIYLISIVFITFKKKKKQMFSLFQQ